MDDDILHPDVMDIDLPKHSLVDNLRIEFQNEEFRVAYAESHLNASLAFQIKALRGNMTQRELAEKVGTKQSGIARLENVNYSSWNVSTLCKLARAFGLRLRISFEEFGALPNEIEHFKDLAVRRRFEDDPVFKTDE